MNEFMEAKVALSWQDLKPAYDVVIIGGGGHGLSAAYYLATRHGITNVAVIERNYIGGGNSGRNTTVIRANYGIPETVKFNIHSVRLYEQLEAETDRWIMHDNRGLLWLQHSEAALRAERGREIVNQEYGADTVFVTREEIKEICPEVDLEASGHSEYRVLGGTYSAHAATARHDRVNWALAEGAISRGVHVHQRTTVTGIQKVGDKVVGVETDRGPISAGMVMCAVGGQVSQIADMAGLRLPIRTHQLQAFVTNHYERTFKPIVASVGLTMYFSQTARGEMLVGAEYDRQPSYSYRSGYEFLTSCAHKAATLFPFIRQLRILRQWTGVCDMSMDSSPIMGKTGLENFVITTGWGTGGFKAIPASGESMAALIATGETPELIAPFALDRFARDRMMADPGSVGTH